MREFFNKTKQLAGLVLRVAVAAAIAGVVIAYYDELSNLDVRGVVDSAGTVVATVLSVWAIFLVKGICFVVPAIIIYTAVGVAFPTGWAILISSVGIILEVALTYFLGRFLGGSFVEKRLRGKKGADKILSMKNKNKFSAVLGMRVLPVVPIDFFSLFLGASKMNFPAYILASFLGIIPRVVLFTILGDKVYDLIPMDKLLLAVVAVLLAAAVAWVVKYVITARRKAQEKYIPLCREKRTLILDTDIGPDCDDAGALAVLFGYMKKYGFPLAGVVNCTSNPYGNGAIKAIAKFCGYPDVAVAQYEKEGLLADCEKYNKPLCEKYLEGDEKANSAQGALEFYKNALEKAEKNSVVIVTIGQLNTVYELMKEHPDLVKKKVYALVSMAAEYPKGREFNVFSDAVAGKEVIEKFPNPIFFSGFEVGKDIQTGFSYVPLNAKRNPVYDAYRLYVGEKKLRSSWDLTAVQYAVEGNSKFYKLTKPQKVTVDETGANICAEDKHGDRYFIVKRKSDKKIAAYLNKMLSAYDNN